MTSTDLLTLTAVLVALLLVVGGGWWFWQHRKAAPPTSLTDTEAETPAAVTETSPPTTQPTADTDTATTADPADADSGAAVSPGSANFVVSTADAPESVQSRWVRLKSRLARSGSPLGARLLGVLSRDNLTEDDWDELEETLLLADVGAEATGELVERLRTRVRVEGLADATATRNALRDELIALLDPTLDRSINVTGATADSPAAIVVVGVNGTGKTTTIGKLTRLLVAQGRTVLLGAADTFRAAAADQLQTWGSRVGVTTIRADHDGADPASVAFEAVRVGVEQGIDVVLVDTAGRLQNKAGLMDELGKIIRVVSRQTPVSEVLLVLDATTGQNGLTQARVFAQIAGVTGIVLTKMDGTARGGVVVAVQRELGVPVKLVGLGEGPDDLAPFDVESFVEGLLGE